jgi:hypothetical protein
MATLYIRSPMELTALACSIRVKSLFHNLRCIAFTTFLYCPILAEKAVLVNQPTVDDPNTTARCPLNRKKTTNPNPSPTDKKFGFVLFAFERRF